MTAKVQEQYATDRNLRARSNLVGTYSGRNWFEWVHQNLNLTSGSSVLDVGCGMGWFWLDKEAAKTPLERLVLVDTSPALLEQAQTNLSSLDWVGTVEAMECDAVSLPFDDQSFDAVLALHMLYHVADQKAAIKELARVMRSGGKVAISTNSLENSRTLGRLAQEAFGGTGRDPGAELFSPETGYDLLSQHFEKVERLEFIDELRITDAEDVYAALVSMPPGNEASDAERARLRELLADCSISTDHPLVDNRNVFLLIAGHGG